jgi:Leucine Rich repeat
LLYLNYNPIGNEGAAAFAASPQRAGLRELDVRHCTIRREGAQALADSAHLDAIETIWLGGNRIPLETVTLLRRRFGDRVRF